MKEFLEVMGVIVFAIVVGIGTWLLIIGITSGFVMLLWNAVLPDLFRVPEISIWQAAGISLLCGLLFHPPQPSNPQARERAEVDRKNQITLEILLEEIKDQTRGGHAALARIVDLLERG